MVADHRAIKKIGVCGAGTMGAGIAQIAAASGHGVVVFDAQQAALETARNGLAARQDKAVARGKRTAQECEALTRRIVWTDRIETMRDCDLVIEAIVEDRAAKMLLFARLEEVTDACIATNTSSLSITELGCGLRHPERFLGLHFFNPAPVMALVEVVPGRMTDPHLAATLSSLMRLWGKTAVVARDVPGFIVNRLARPFYGEAWRALEEGVADAATIDYLYRTLAKFRMGPLELGDLIGHDINYAASETIFHAYFGRTRFRPSLLQNQLVAAGHVGRKAGRGIRHGSHDTATEVATAAATRRADAIRGPVRLSADPGPIGALCRTAPNLRVETDKEQSAAVMVEEIAIGISDGIPAHARARQSGAPAVVIDWPGLDGDGSTLCYSASDKRASDVGAGLILGLDMTPVEIADRPGGLVFRTFLQLANCAADALCDKVATADALDQAMLLGVNYPVGPLAWARAFGPEAVIAALAAIAEETGDSIYAPSEGLRHIVSAAHSVYGT